MLSNVEKISFSNFKSFKSRITKFDGKIVECDSFPSPIGTLCKLSCDDSTFVKGEIIDAYVYNKGSNYGSTILNHQVKPDINILNGKNGEIKPIVVNGRIDSAAVVNKGEGYFSTPDLEITDAGTGSGAIIRPVVENGKIINAIIINSGIGYDSLTTDIKVVPRGSNGSLGARVRPLTLNRSERFGDFNLTSRKNSFGFSILQYSQDIVLSLIHI